MHVRKGVDPQNADKDVVFRTTYYFRVSDICDASNPTGVTNAASTSPFINKHGRPQYLIKDSLYRFVMTGKANPVFNKIHFESGVLKSFEIDPFGATVDFDEDNERFYFKSREQTELEARRGGTTDEIRRLLALKKEMEDGKADQALLAALDAVMLSHLRSLSLSEIGGLNVDKQLATAAKTQSAAAAAVQKAADAFATLATFTLAEKRKAATEVLGKIPDELDKTKKAIENLSKNSDVAKIDTAVSTLAGSLLALRNNPNPAAANAFNAVDGHLATLKNLIGDGTADSKPRHLSKQVLDAMIGAKNVLTSASNAHKASAEATAEAGTETGKAEATREPARAQTEAAMKAQRALDLQNRIAVQAIDDATTARATANGKAGAVSTRIAILNADPLNDAAEIATPALDSGAYDNAHKALFDTVDEIDALVTSAKAVVASDLTKAKQNITNAEAKAKALGAAATKALLDEAKKAVPADGTDGTVATDKKVAATLAKKYDDTKSEAEGLVTDAQAAAEAYTTAAVELRKVASTNSAAAFSIVGKMLQDPQNACAANGGNLRRGFQVMGPEGVKTFNQDDRLIMAMSTSAKPLVGMLKDLSGRVLNQRAAGADQLLPLARERTHILRAERALDRERAREDATPEEVIDATVQAFEQGRTTP